MCHNRLYGRGMENADSDLTMDMVRILLAKIYDETVTSDTAYPHSGSLRNSTSPKTGGPRGENHP